MPGPFDHEPHVVIALALDSEDNDNQGGYPSAVFGPFPTKDAADRLAKALDYYSDQTFESHRLQLPVVASLDTNTPEAP